MEGTMNLSAPWYTYAKKVKAFFAYDDEITVGELEKLGNGHYSLTITVKNPAKAYALDKLVRPDTAFGETHVFTDVALDGVDSTEGILRTAFKGHFAVSDVATKAVPGGNNVYLRFQPEIIQFYNDDLSDFAGNYTELIHKVAAEIIDFDNYCVRPCIVDLRENE
jgi:hypothetical protein